MNLRHIPIVLALLALEFSLPWIWPRIYLPIMRQRVKTLQQQGFEVTSGRDFKPALPDEVKEKVVFAAIKKSPNEVVEALFTQRGNYGRIVSSNGRLISADWLYVRTLAVFVLPIIGFMLMFVATLHQMIRVREILKSRLAKFPLDRTESTLYLYGAPLFASSFLVLPLLQKV